MNKQNSVIAWIIFILVVVVLVAILIPKYNSLSKELRLAKVQNLASHLTASAVANYSLRKTKAASGVPVKNCKDAAHFVENGLPENYQISDQPVQRGEVVICHLIDSKSGSVAFSVMGID